jgi:release factor glutamine methyltransferase
MKLSQSLRHIQASLVPIAGEFSLPESERILEYLLDLSRSDLYLSGREELPEDIAGKIDGIVARRVTGEPLAYILGSAYFFDREIRVGPAVLIPRPDTETLVEIILRHEANTPRRFLEFGTGSGCISAVLAGRNPQWIGVAVDISLPALRVAQKNCGPSIFFACCDHFPALKNENFDFIVANPPYIPAGVIPSLDRSVRDFEPIGALDGGEDGLDFFRSIADSARTLLLPNGRVYCEIGFDQGDAVSTIMMEREWRNIRVSKDLGGRDRVVSCMK